MSIILIPPESSIAFSFLNYDIRWYGIIISISILFGILFCLKLIKDEKQKDLFIDFIPYVIIFSIIGARTFYVLGDINFYLKHPIEIFLINHGGLSIQGGIIFGIISLIYFSKKMNFSALKFLDLIATTMPFCQAIGRWGNFFNQEAYGAPFEGFIKMYIEPKNRILQYKDVEYYHPTFLYESLADFILFLVLLFLYKNKKLKKGTIFSLYLIFYSIIRIFVETLRIDSVLNVFNIPCAIIISILIIFVGFILLLKKS